jgi:uridine kinase
VSDAPAGPAAPPAADLLAERIDALVHAGGRPVLVALDGRSGVGKSTLAAAVGQRTGAAVIDGDDFYHGASAEHWDSLPPAQRMAGVIDWRRQRAVLECLAGRRRAVWHPYDWEADDGSVAAAPNTCSPADAVLLEGAYSARPELADLFSLRVLLDVPPDVRRARLLRREGERYRTEWEARWSAAEDLYFETVMPAAAFDFVLDGR